MSLLAKDSNSFRLIVYGLFFISLPVLSQPLSQIEPFFYQAALSDGALRLAANDSDTTENLPSAVVWYLEMAKRGDKDAQYNLGSIYETGFGVTVDLKEAVKWYDKAARQGHQMAQLKLGMMYYLGKGTKQSVIRGDKWIRKAAKSGNTLALLLKERVIAHDVDNDIKPEKLIAKTLRAFDKGQINAEETLRLELQKIKRNRRNKAEKPRFAGTVTGSAAKAGSVKNEVPDFLTENPQTPGTPDLSFTSIRRKALDGNAKAQYELGRMYEVGEGVSENLKQAFKWYSASAAQDYPNAQYRLGLAYLYGIGTQPNTIQGGVWLKKARDNLHPAATLLLNTISSGPGGIIDKPHSILLSWYLERSLAGNGKAMLGLGNMFERGWGVEKNVETAKRWYTKARAAGAKGASIRLRQIKAEMAATEKPSSSQDEGDSAEGRFIGSRAYLTTAVLLVLVLFMAGFLVFRRIKGSNHRAF